MVSTTPDATDSRHTTARKLGMPIVSPAEGSYGSTKPFAGVDDLPAIAERTDLVPTDADGRNAVTHDLYSVLYFGRIRLAMLSCPRMTAVTEVSDDGGQLHQGVTERVEHGVHSWQAPSGWPPSAR